MPKTFRVYFNCREDAPFVFSMDEGRGSCEHNYASVRLENVTAVFRFDRTRGQPCAWFEVEGELEISPNSAVAVIRGR